MNNTRIIDKNRKINTRFIFGIVFPILLSLIPLGIALSGYNSLQTKRVEILSTRWEEKAKLVLNDVRSCWSFEDYLDKSAKRFIKIADESPNIDPNIIINRAFPKRIIDNSQIWLFKKHKKRLQVIKGKSLQTHFKSAMRKIANALIDLKENSHKSTAKTLKHERFISGVFGNQSLPKYLARQQEGILTPITFKGKNKYLLWLTTDKSGYCLIAVISPKVKIDLVHSLQKTANRIFRQYKKQIAVAFCPAHFVNVEESIILPDIISNNDSINNRFQKLLSGVNKEIDFLDKVPYETMFSRNNHVFLESYITKNNPYNAIIFAPKPRTIFHNYLTYSKTILIALFAWIFIFVFLYIKNQTIGLPLQVSFQFFFFIVGISATTLIFLFGQNIISESYSSSLRELKEAGLANLLKIDDEGANLVENYYDQLSKHIKSKTYDILCSPGKAIHKIAFEDIRRKMNQQQLALDYLLLISPDYGSEAYSSGGIQDSSLKEFLDLFTAFTSNLQSAYSKFVDISLKRPILLTNKQLSIHKMLKTYGYNFTSGLLKAIIEKGGFFQIGTSSKTFFTLFILQNGQNRIVYSIFGVNSYQLFKKYLFQKLAKLNFTNSNEYAAMLTSKDEKFLFPKKNNEFWSSKKGKTLLTFMNKSMKSSFPIYLSDDQNLYITAPMKNSPNSTSGAILSLSKINSEKQKKSLINLIFFIITSLITYFISSLITSYLISPLSGINLALADISSGYLNSKLERKRNDELGILSTTINTMQEGLLEKQKLGKFVSTVFSDALASTSSDQLKEGISFTGTILFSDIRNFTTMSEKYSPNDIASMLNTHLSQMAHATNMFEGQVEQFIGDAIVAVFPDKPNSNGYDRAIKSAKEMMIKHLEIQDQRRASKRFTYSIGIGLDHGKLIAGSLITDERAEFSVIGQPRTNAELNEAASKQGRYTRIIISATIMDKINNKSLFAHLPNDKNKFELITIGELL